MATVFLSSEEADRHYSSRMMTESRQRAPDGVGDG
jgi:hypothetical protein